MKDLLRNLLPAVCGLFVMSGVAQAHPGHGNPVREHTIWHYLTEPMHVLPALGLLVVAAWAVRGYWLGRSDKSENER